LRRQLAARTRSSASRPRPSLPLGRGLAVPLDAGPMGTRSFCGDDRIICFDAGGASIQPKDGICPASSRRSNNQRPAFTPHSQSRDILKVTARPGVTRVPGEEMIVQRRMLITVALVLVALMVAATIGSYAYRAGVARGLEDSGKLAAPGTAVPYPY